jgi:D-alanyl-D-alanine carboxypeptidase
MRRFALANILASAVLLFTPTMAEAQNAEPALAQPAVPDTQAGKAFGAWLSALDAADPSRMEAVMADYHLTGTVANYMNFAHQTGGFDLLGIEQSIPDALTVIVGERNSERIARGTFTLTRDSAGNIVRSVFEVGGIPREGAYAIPRLTQVQALKALESRAGTLAAQDKFSGAYLIAQSGKVLAVKAFGWSDRESKTPATPETKFRMGSINKVFTAVAVFQLIAAGKISLDGTVGTYLPDYPNKEIASKVTIRELLTHTAGTGDFYTPEYIANRLKVKTLADYIALLGGRAPLFEPGSKDAYSNFGFVILGNIIERVSGVSYYDYVAKYIFAPAGMTNTASLPEDQRVPGRATAYMSQKGEWVSAADTLPYRGIPSGGGYSTVGDLFKFAQALQNGKLLPGRLAADATTPHDHHGDYGYGFVVAGQGMLQSFGHNGAAPGMSGDLIIYPALKRVVVVLSNYDPPVAENLADFYTNRMPATP